ncbi:hypothetical protein T10_4128 [Trichinella papuae]|uniref:Uncharacterized protein n=1 Tax=Trichinella papuae TaxID=268474 RepID=A0A0V1MZX6_9BILA|nr:hypothetical protein T10_4128 [Trichinella papuae]
MQNIFTERSENFKRAFIPIEDIKTQGSFLPLFCQMDANNRIKQQKRVISSDKHQFLSNSVAYKCFIYCGNYYCKITFDKADRITD